MQKDRLQEIDYIIEELKQYWKSDNNAELRLGQLISNMAGINTDIFNIQDSQIIALIKDTLQYQFTDTDNCTLIIKPNYQRYSDCDKREPPIYVEIHSENNMNNECIALNVNQAKDLQLALQNIIKCIEVVE